ncbi:hypothetical protein GQ457_16G009180 [Hibiscus cannabinus]
MPDKSSAMVHTQYLPFLSLSWEAGGYSWGSAILAFLYREMCKAAKMSSVDGRALNADIGGCMVLLQSWAWYRLPFLAPICPAPSEFPLATRWRQRKDRALDHKVTLAVRMLIDMCCESEFIWRPYLHEDVFGLIPERAYEDAENWCSIMPLIHFALVEMFYGNRVLRQFGFHQPVPAAPRNMDELEQIDTRGKTEKNWPLTHWIGMQFETIDQAKSAIKLYNIRKSVHSKVTRSTSEKYVCECTQRKEQGCNWKVRVSKKKRKQNIWELSVYNGPHTCCAVGHRQDHPNLDSTIISQTVQPIVQASPKVTVSTLMAHVKSVYQYEPEYKKTWRAKDKALKKLHGDWDASYNELPGWINIMQKYNPGTIAVLETKPYYKNDRVVADVRQFHRHVLLLAVIQDGNRKTIPVAFALVPREDTDSCKFFLQNLRKHFFRHNTVCLISDRGSGFLSAIESLGSRFCSPKVEHRYCLRHIAANYHGRYKKDYERKLILRMGMFHSSS